MGAAKGAAFQAAVLSGPAIAPAPIAAGPVGYSAPIAPVVARAGPIIAPAAPIIAGPRPYVGPLAGVPQLVAHPNGAVTPADEPAVVAARADHLAAKGAAFQAAVLSGPGLVGPVAGPAFAPAPIAPAFGYARAPLAGPPALVTHPNGAVVPVD